MLHYNIILHDHVVLQVLAPAVQSLHTSTANRDIEQAAKFIGAGAATVGCAGRSIGFI